ncbi:hypothetical protein SOVF_182540, partial [Spinacia oleracea]
TLSHTLSLYKNTKCAACLVAPLLTV